ncbi:TetR/AcrR family transcriptional regulator [Pendulispora rubella]|uniref:TetR/AcrR family transcriptional regulator n=2 Tax=Pendulispora rubella TaxID=2741070 RepID=A0ABZ2LM54_9BACT
MADLAESVGLRKASLFHHFASKDALYNAVFERLVHNLGGLVIEAAQTEGSFVERLDLMTDSFVSALGVQVSAARLILRELMDWGPFVRVRFGETWLPVLKAAERFVEDGQREGSFSPELSPRHVILSGLSLYMTTFAIGGVVEQFASSDCFAPDFVEERKKQLRTQLHAMLLRPGHVPAQVAPAAPAAPAAPPQAEAPQEGAPAAPAEAAPAAEGETAVPSLGH